MNTKNKSYEPKYATKNRAAIKTVNLQVAVTRPDLKNAVRKAFETVCRRAVTAQSDSATSCRGRAAPDEWLIAYDSCPWVNGIFVARPFQMRINANTDLTAAAGNIH